MIDSPDGLPDAPKPKPGRKPKKQRAPRVVKKREYRVFRVHSDKQMIRAHTEPSGTPGVDSVITSTGLLIEEMQPHHPDQRAARQWIKDNAKDGETYMCACVLFVAKAVQKTAIEIE